MVKVSVPPSLALLQSRLLATLLRLNQPQTKLVLRRAAAAGSAYAVLALLFGGFYETPWQLPGLVLRVAYKLGVTLSEYVARGFKPLFAEWTLSFELTRALMRCMMSSYGRRLLNPANAQFLRRQSELLGQFAGFFLCRQFGVSTEPFMYNGLKHVWLRSVDAPSNPRHRVVVLYYHGGGYAVLSPRMYIPFCCELQHRIKDRLGEKLGDFEGVRVEFLLANYRKVPEHQHPIPPQDALTMYHYLINEEKLTPSQIIIAGDSAGGGLTMTTLLRLRDSRPELLPAAAILSCPYVDLEIGGDERKTPYCILGDQANDAVYEAYHPRDGHPSTWGDASPVHCDLSGLPPVYIQAAELDYILPHSKRLMEKAKADGVTNWDLEIFHNVPHVFTVFPTFMLPSAARGLDAMAEYAATHFSRAIQTAASA